ncbi:hypothetical protein [Celerinatantimonas yamalensis]|uniref:Uncharacterized protein n=1 Tax=Celerinatantimonas yamalensis TaxID=559956 RepID=A0ABW9G925_9GAMM
MVQNGLRAIDWVPDGNIKLRPRTFTIADAPDLIASENLFARKFDRRQDEAVISALEHHLETAISFVTPHAAMPKFPTSLPLWGVPRTC